MYACMFFWGKKRWGEGKGKKRNSSLVNSEKMPCLSSSLSISLLDERNEHTHNILVLFLIVYRHRINEEVYRLSPSLVTVLRCLLVNEREREQNLFLGNKTGRLLSVRCALRFFFSLSLGPPFFSHADGKFILWNWFERCPISKTSRRACQPEHAVKRQQIIRKRKRKRKKKKKETRERLC